MSNRFKPEKKVFDKDGQETFAHLHNAPIISRRELLSSGLIRFSATMTLPSIFHILSKTEMAFAQEMTCATAGAKELIPVICLNLSGGAALSANWVPLDQGQQLLPSYNKMGLGATRNLVIEYAMGAPFAGNNVSRLLVGLKANAPTAMPTTSFVGVAVRSRDDSNVNKFDISGLITKAGLAGNFLPNLGSSATATGNKNDFAYVKPPTPLTVNRFTDLTSSLGVAASLDQLNSQQKEKLFKMVKNLNESQSRRLASVSGGKEMSHLVNCASGANIDIVAKGSSGVDPLNNAAFAGVWGITAATDKNSQDYVFAAMVYNGLVGNAGMVNLEMGGYDYHNGTRTSGDQRDQAAGVVMGKILESAKILNKKMFLVVTSDGSVSSAVSEASNAPWMSDRGTAGACYMLAFDPLKKPTQTGSQLGYYNIGQGADESFITGSSPELAAAGIFANYLSFSNQMPRLEKVLPRVFSADQLKSILKVYGA